MSNPIPNPPAPNTHPTSPVLSYEAPNPNQARAHLWFNVISLFCFLTPFGYVFGEINVPSGLLRSIVIAMVLACPPCGLVFALIARSKAKKIRASTTASTALFVATLALTAYILLAIFSTSLSGRARGDDNRVKCGNNLSQLGRAMFVYASDHQNKFPPSFDELLLEEDLVSEVLICPSSNGQKATGATTQQMLKDLHSNPNRCTYIYLGASLTYPATPDTILAHEPLANHNNAGMNVLFGDGHVEWIDAKYAKYLLSELAAGRNPPKTQPASGH